MWISFNGEIFNYVELGEELRRCGHRFRTASDTEVIVHAWEEWGEQCFTRFNGQWALALWDSREQRLVLSRDRLGVRPLFFTRDRHRIAFASEVKALMADPAVPRAFDPIGLDEVLTYWSTVAPRTVFAGIEQLEPGHVAVLDRDGFRAPPLLEHRLPRPGRRAGPGHRGQRRRAARAPRRGGPAALRAQRRTRRRLPLRRHRLLDHRRGDRAGTPRRRCTPSRCGSPTRSSTKGVYQQQMVAELGAQHEEIAVSTADIAEVFPEVVRHTETPVLRTAPAPLFLLSRLVRENGYKVVVTGEGADEVLGGYDIFREAPGARASGPATPARPPATARSSCSTRGWSATPAAHRRSRAASSASDLDADDPAISHRPRWDSTARSRRCWPPDVRGRARPRVADVAVARCRPAATHWDPLCARPVAGDDHAAAGLHPVQPGRPDADGQLGRGALPVPRPRGRRARQPAPGAPQAVRARREAPAQARLRGPRPRADPPPAQAALPRPRRRQLLQRPRRRSG